MRWFPPFLGCCSSVCWANLPKVLVECRVHYRDLGFRSGRLAARLGLKKSVPHLREIKLVAVIPVSEAVSEPFLPVIRMGLPMDDVTARFALSPTMKIEDCQRFHAFLASASDKHLAIECSAVERLSGLTAQMLAMACRCWSANALKVTFVNPSNGFVQGLALLGLSELRAPGQVSA